MIDNFLYYSPSGFRDDGLYCAKPGAYGRGAGYVAWKRDKCEREHPDVGCEKVFIIIYKISLMISFLIKIIQLIMLIWSFSF